MSQRAGFHGMGTHSGTAFKSFLTTSLDLNEGPGQYELLLYRWGGSGRKPVEANGV